MHPGPITLRVADWNRDLAAIRAVREPVFIVEQEVPVELEWDDTDPVALHVIAEASNREPVGTGRLEPTGKIGRVAVVADARGQGVGRKIMKFLVDQAVSEGFSEIYLNSQVHALGFYADLGFVAEGPVFDEAGIPHRRMVLAR